MNRPRTHTAPVIRLVLAIACTSLCACSWVSGGGAGKSATGAADAERERLRNEVRHLKLDVAQKDAEIHSLMELNHLLEDELATTESDLEQVERQFVSMERGLIRDETKASAVATIAEVRLLLDALLAEDPVPLDEETVADVESKLSSANDLTRKRNYSAAVYYANRAMRILNQSERRYETLGTRRVVSVTRANMREGPGQNFPVVARLDYGTVILELEKKDEWFHIRTRMGTEGWIHSSLLR